MRITLECVCKAQLFILSLSKDEELGGWQTVETSVILRQAQDEVAPENTLQTRPHPAPLFLSLSKRERG